MRDPILIRLIIIRQFTLQLYPFFIMTSEVRCVRFVDNSEEAVFITQWSGHNLCVRLYDISLQLWLASHREPENESTCQIIRLCLLCGRYFGLIAPADVDYLSVQSLDYERILWRLLRMRVIYIIFGIYIFIFNNIPFNQSVSKTNMLIILLQDIRIFELSGISYTNA